MMLRRLLAMLAFLALAGGGLHGASMAQAEQQLTVSLVAVSKAAVSDCHNELAKAERQKAADCCPTGCDGNCTMIGAFFAAAPIRNAVAFLRAALDAPVRAMPVTRSNLAVERPPKDLA